MYISDFNNNLINIYAGVSFTNQAPCGQLGPDVGLINPQGMFVKSSNHRLLVANTGANNVLMFARGGTVPIKVYVDPTGQFPVDVTMANDGTVIASNIFSTGVSAGTISTWHTNAAFVGNFPMVNDTEGLYLTVQANGDMYFNDIDATTGSGALWKGSCPLGACGAFVQEPPTTSFPGGLRSRTGDTKLIEFDQLGGTGGTRIRYGLPSFAAVSCNINGEVPVSFDMNSSQTTIWYADAANNLGVEMSFNCATIGTVTGNPSGLPIGAAVDVPEPL